MIKRIYLSIILIIFLLFGCNNNNNNNNKIKIDKDEFYNDYPEYYDHFVDYNYNEFSKRINPAYITNVIKRDSNNFSDLRIINEKEFEPYITNQEIEILRDNLRDFLFYKYLVYKADIGKHLNQIEYPFDSTKRKKILIFSFEDIDYPKNQKAIVIQWTSKPTNTEFLKYARKEDKIHLYMWGINKTTDTIVTNASLSTIKILYPDFEGKYIFKKYNEIIIDHSYSSLNRTLFEHIVFK